MKPSRPNKKRRVSKAQWLEKALETLAASGVEAVKIERLAKALGVARSGFYWHFKNHQNLLQHLLDFWADEYTGVVTDNSELKALDANKRLLVTMEMVRDFELAKYDLAMFSWAKSDPLVRKVVQKVIEMRLDHVRAIFKELGFRGDEIEMRSRLFVCYYSWEGTMFADLHGQKQSKIKALRYKLFTKK